MSAVASDLPEASRWAGAPGDAGSRFELDAACRSELASAAAELRANPLPLVLLDPGDLRLDACRSLMAHVERALSAGTGFALVDRLPVESVDVDDATALYWLLMRLLGRPVAQKWDGRMVYSVRDEGRPPGYGVRPDVTNREQGFHTDNSYNLCPPERVSLLCLATARSGGVSRIASLHTAHALLADRAPDLLRRLYRPVVFDRQNEHAPDAPKTLSRAVFTREGERLRGRISYQLIRQGHALAGKPLDPQGEAALDAMYALLDDPALHREFHFEPGQIQVLDNRFVAHKRTGFEDWPEPSRRRHLVRLWLRDADRRFYNG